MGTDATDGGNGTTATEHPDADVLRDVAHLLHLPAFDPALIDPGTLVTLMSQRNSGEATGTRMRRYLQHLLEQDVTHVVDRSDLWRAMLEHCDSLTPLQAYTMRNLMGTASNAGYPAMPDDVRLEFPRDDQVFTGAQSGWHFLVGSLWDADGNEYGIEYMLFGQALYPPHFAKEVGLSPVDNLAVEVQFAISAKGGRHHQAEPLVALGTSGLIRVSTSPFEFHLGANSMVSSDRSGLLPLRVRAGGWDLGGDSPLQLGCDLRLTAAKGVLEQGEHGAMPSIGGIGTRYYSLPSIQLDGSRSTISIDGATIPIVRGELWFDHQWGTLSGVSKLAVMRAANAIDEPNPSGWDWFMAHLSGDRQVTMFATHSNEFRSFYFQDGDTAPPTMSRRVSGTFMDADSSTRVVWGTMEVDRWVQVQHTPNPDRYPATNTWYPDHYRFTFDDLPDDLRELTMTPIVEGGQSAFFSHGIQICEGAVVVRDAAGHEVGRGFAEAVAFADSTRNQLRLAGLPETGEMLELVREPTPSAELAAANAAYVASHTDELARVLGRAEGLAFFTDPTAAPTS